MPKQKLFDDESEDEVSFKTENEYAKKYDAWREKEELHKLEQKYGDKPLNSDASISSDSEDESDEPPEVSEEMETQFLKTLALLKTKDPRIYDPGFKCFENNKTEEPEKEEKKKSLTFADSDDDDDDDGDIFTVEKKATQPNTSTESSKDNINTSTEGKLKDYLTGKAEHIDTPVERDLAPLKALWSDPNINEGEAFLRDYILNKKYLEADEAGGPSEQVRDDDELEADERTVEEQGKFERAYNFRFEEPDQEYLKRFPRTMNYTRPKDERRARKRAELRARKDEQRNRKMEEIARLKALKLKEIHDKIQKIKEVTGNDDLAFKEEDIEGDFDPAEHDRRMQALFDEHYYMHKDTHKPEFPDIDQELDIENWDEYEPTLEDAAPGDEGEPHCEDDNFNMDADYDPKQARTNLLEEIKRNLGNKRRNRKKKSKLAALLAADKPVYIPGAERGGAERGGAHGSGADRGGADRGGAEREYAQFMEQYYAMDCEDVIGDLPTRFKYREVVPNDYGLTVEEILLADDKELTQWVPLKKVVKYRPHHVEKGDVTTYAQRAADVNLKKKILPSLFKDLPEEPEIVVPEGKTNKKKKKKKKNKDKNTENETNDNHDNSQQEDSETNIDNNTQVEDTTIDNTEDTNNKKEKRKKKKDKKNRENNNDDTTEINLDNNTTSEEIIIDSTEQTNTNKIEKRKKKKNNTETVYDEIIQEQNITNLEPEETTVKTEQNNTNKKNKRNKKNKLQNIQENSHSTESTNDNNTTTTVSKKNKSKHKNNNFTVEDISNIHPTQTSENKNNKRKMDKQDNGPSAKKKKFQNKKDFKSKFNQNKSENALDSISDGRLKAFGLNPKKYKNFLKYKKF